LPGKRPPLQFWRQSINQGEIIMSSMFISRFMLKPEKTDEFIGVLKGLFAAAGDLMKDEVNFYFYGWGRKPNEFVAVESWKNEDVVNALRQTDGFKEAFSKMVACAAEPMTLEIFADWNEDPKALFDLYPKGQSKLHPVIDGKPTFFL
jgi:quinol monooxygenase YgiN